MKALLGNKTLLIILFLVLLVFLYVGAKGTYTAYESNVSGNVGNKVSQIHFAINGEELGTDAVLDNRVILENVTWTSNHTREGKMSPGSTGNFQFELDPTGSEVAILYELKLIDKVVDADKILTFTNISSDRTLTRTAIDTYSGIFTLSDIENHAMGHVTIYFSFDDTEDFEGFTDDDQTYEDFFEIEFRALQYQGEVLVPYSE